VVGRRALLLAGAGALLSGCGTGADRAAEATTPGPGTATRRRGDAEVLDGLLGVVEEGMHAERLREAIRGLGATPTAEGWMATAGPVPRKLARRIAETTLAACIDALPKLSDGRLRELVATIAADEAAHLAALDGALGHRQAAEAFVAGRRSL
jgi:hypothetical protein